MALRFPLLRVRGDEQARLMAGHGAVAFVANVCRAHYAFFPDNKARNSRRSDASARNFPRITLLVILAWSSLVPRQCMQKC